MTTNIRTIIKVTFLALSALVLANTNVIYAADENCVTQYGGGVVCGSRTPVESHAPVKAGLGDINLGYVGLALVSVSGALFIYGKRQNSNSSQPSV